MQRTLVATLVIVILAGLFLVTPVQAGKVTVSQGIRRNKEYDEKDWNLCKDVTSIQEDGMMLTKAEKQQSGYAYMNQAIQLNEQCDFSLAFDFSMKDGDASGADGIAFVIQRRTNSAGTLGQGMGYQGLTPSLAVEFDSYSNGDFESSNHIGIMLNGDAVDHKGYADLTGTFEFNSDAIFRTWIDYHDKTVEVRLATLDAAGTAKRPTDALATLSVDLYELLGQNTVFVGCSSATGGSYARHVVSGFTFDNQYHANGVPIDSEEEATPSIPEVLQVKQWKGETALVAPTTSSVENAQYMFFEKEEDLLPCAVGTEFTVPATNTTNRDYYYSVLSSTGKQSGKQKITVSVLEEGTYTEKVTADARFAPASIEGMKDAYALPDSFYHKGAVTREFTVKDATGSVSEQDIALLQQMGGISATGQLYMNLTIGQNEVGGSPVLLTSLTKPVTVKVSIPSELRKEDNTFEILRLHDGQVTKLDCVVDKVNWTVTFATDRFSIYALTFTEHKKVENQQNTTKDAELDVDPSVLPTTQNGAELDADEGYNQKKTANKDANETDAEDNAEVPAPKTGDDGTMIVWLLLFGSLTGMAVIAMILGGKHGTKSSTNVRTM